LTAQSTKATGGKTKNKAREGTLSRKASTMMEIGWTQSDKVLVSSSATSKTNMKDIGKTIRKKEKASNSNSAIVIRDYFKME
jgi:hypothetical protein